MDKEQLFRMGEALRVLARWLADPTVRRDCPGAAVGYACPHRECVVRRRATARVEDCWVMAAVKVARESARCADDDCAGAVRMG